MEVLTQCELAEVRRLEDADEFFWLDLYEPSHEDLERLGEQLDLHPAALEDSREWRQLPKVDRYGHHLLLVFFTAETLDPVSEPREVHVYLSGNWIVTVRRCRTRLDAIHDRLRRADPAAEGEDLVVYRILDALADGWDPVVRELDARVDEIEEQVLERPRPEQPKRIYRLKQEVADLLRHAARQATVMPQAVEVMHALPGLSHGSREWLRDVTTHCDAVASDLRRISGDLSALTDTYFNASANRLNRLVNLVTVASVFFLLWTLVTGFFGQNFEWLLERIDTEWAFWVFGAGGLLVPSLVLAALLWWRRRDWL